MELKKDIEYINLVKKSKESQEKKLKEIELYDYVLSIFPNDISCINNKGKAYFLLGRLEESVEYFDKVIKVNPQDLEAHLNKGRVLTELKKYDQAIEYYEKCILFNQKSSPTYDSILLAHAYNGKGIALAKKKDFKRSIICFNLALSIDPNFADAINNRSAAQNKLGMLEESVNGFNRIVSNQSQSINQTYHYFVYNKARTLFKNKRFNEAIDEYD